MPFAQRKQALVNSQASSDYLRAASSKLDAIRATHAFTEYKLDAAWYYLDRFKQLLHDAGGGLTSGPGAQQGARFELQATLDALLAELIGVRDAVLQEIVVALNLPIPPHEVTVGKVTYEANAKGTGHVPQADQHRDGRRQMVVAAQ